jgi:hypothetical protein
VQVGGVAHHEAEVVLASLAGDGEARRNRGRAASGSHATPHAASASLSVALASLRQTDTAQ